MKYIFYLNAMSDFKLFHLMGIFIIMLFATSETFTQEMVFPEGAVVDVTKEPWNVDNTGTSDVTNLIKEAFQRARDNSYVLYFPNGTYLVSNTIQLIDLPADDSEQKKLSGQRIWGQSKDSTIIKLKDNAYGYGNASDTKYVIDFMPNINWANKNMSNYIENLTIDVGTGNPGVSGVRFHTNNSGCIRNLIVKSNDGSGIYGINLSRKNNGPGYIKSTKVEGFKIGILCGNEESSRSFHHYCIDQCELIGQSEAGISAIHLPLTILKLKSNNLVPAIDMNGLGQVILLKGDLNGGNTDYAAIESENSAFYFVRDVTFSGYQNLLKYGNDYTGGQLGEYSSHNAVRTGQMNGTGSIGIPVAEPPPISQYDTDEWINVKDYGAMGYGDDDSDGIQAAMNAGGAKVYFPVGTYKISKTISIPAHVRHVDFMFSRFGFFSSDFNNKSNFGFEILGTDPILIERLGNIPTTTGILPGTQSPSYTWFNHASTRTVYFKDMHAQGRSPFYRNSVTGGKVFVEVIKALDKNNKTWVIDGQQLWGRQFNVEDNMTIEASNSQVWLSGGKQENGDTKFLFMNNTIAEVYGHTMLGNFSSSNNPLIINDNSHVVAFMTENARDGSFLIPVREIFNGKTKYLKKQDFPQRAVNKGSTVMHYYAGYDLEYVNSEIATGIKYKDENKKIQIYPNPAENKVYVQSELPFGAIDFINLQGITVKKIKENKTHELLVDKINFESGLYLVKLYTDYGIITRKLLIK